MKFWEKLLIYFLFPVVFLVHLLYSYTQVDLNLTLSSNRYYQIIQNNLLFLGYYNRKLSGALYLIIVFISFIGYIKAVSLINKKIISWKYFKAFLVFAAITLLLSYPAYSYDIFNYMFDARIVTKYMENPYTHKALDFVSDPWTRFMRWTHRTYPYGPLWIILTLIPSYLGFGKFILTLFNFKIFFIIFYFGNLYLIYKIFQPRDKDKILYRLSIYAFNPVILFESVLSPHNDIVTIFFLLLAIYFGIVKNKKVYWWLMIILSAAVKFFTLPLLPLGLFLNFKTDLSKIIRYFLILLIPVIIYLVWQRDAYPWYFLNIIILLCLCPLNKSYLILIYGLTFGSLLYYFPFIYFGEYSNLVRELQYFLPLIPLLIAIIFSSRYLRPLFPDFSKKPYINMH